MESQLIALINQERANQGMGALTQQSQLTAAAQGHSQDMACNNIFSHTGSNGSNLSDRMAAQGYVFSAVAENIAAGYGTAQDVFNGWMGSQGHRDNMLNSVYTQVGIGYAFTSTSDFGTYWTANFGTP